VIMILIESMLLFTVIFINTLPRRTFPYQIIREDFDETILNILYLVIKKLIKLKNSDLKKIASSPHST
jgi:hypothetical protein